MRVTVWGEFLWDAYPDQKRLGGAPANVAFHLALLKTPCTLVTRVGDDVEGREAIRLIERVGVDISEVQIDPTRPTGMVDITLSRGEAIYTLHGDRAWEFIDYEAISTGLLQSTDAFCFGTLSQRSSTGQQSLERAIHDLPTECLRIHDPNLRPKNVDFAAVERSLAWANVIKLNEGEAQLIGEHFQQRDCIRWFLEAWDIKVVALTRGANGCRIVSVDHDVEHPGFRIKKCDSVGAGDSFQAVFTTLLLAGASFEEIAERANRYGAFVTSHFGATPVAPDHLISQITHLPAKKAE